MVAINPLVFFGQLFEVQLDNSEVLLRFSSALVQGATNVFWYDISLCWLYMVDYMKLVVGGFWNGFAVRRRLS